MFGISVGNNVDTTGMLSLLPSSTCRVSWPFFWSLPHPSSEEAGAAQGDGRGTQPGQGTLTNQRDVPCRVTSCSPINLGGKKEVGDIKSNVVCLLTLPLAHVMEPCFPGNG